MNTKLLVILLGGIVLVSGCVKTVNDRHAFAVSPTKDKFESRYERTPDQVYAAALDAVKFNCTVTRESIINPGTNQVRAIEAKANGRNVWVRVQEVDPKVTAVTVQVRTPGGGTDLALTSQLQTQIGIKLASPR
jgi:hypothetical protein